MTKSSGRLTEVKWLKTAPYLPDVAEVRLPMVKMKIKEVEGLLPRHGLSKEYSAESSVMFMPANVHCTLGQGSELTLAMMVKLGVPSSLTMTVPSTRSSTAKGFTLRRLSTVGASIHIHIASILENDASLDWW